MLYCLDWDTLQRPVLELERRMEVMKPGDLTFDAALKRHVKQRRDFWGNFLAKEQAREQAAQHAKAQNRSQKPASVNKEKEQDLQRHHTVKVQDSQQRPPLTEAERREVIRCTFALLLVWVGICGWLFLTKDAQTEREAEHRPSERTPKQKRKDDGWFVNIVLFLLLWPFLLPLWAITGVQGH
ncbi:hypothetical protein BDV96DRAFT_254871 [Lophiotrema nucula]|uniref:Uncharacterized protein n=1 Tax=Lophiotrema nucula TaxID=690887 RepID=A0A6A5YQA8_9PLEO|nr:hypothetical protein BDV96DRAFT_254871 [Lophiotrema nucula]